MSRPRVSASSRPRSSSRVAGRSCSQEHFQIRPRTFTQAEVFLPLVATRSPGPTQPAFPTFGARQTKTQVPGSRGRS
eukprot:6238933-Alexandrium_andersonii.AAC.1